MSVTRYFAEQVLRKRPYLTEELCRKVLADPLREEVQADGRVRFWGRIVIPTGEEPRILRVVTLDDRRTIHNAFPDRSFREDTEP